MTFSLSKQCTFGKTTHFIPQQSKMTKQETDTFRILHPIQSNSSTIRSNKKLSGHCIRLVLRRLKNMLNYSILQCLLYQNSIVLINKKIECFSSKAKWFDQFKTLKFMNQTSPSIIDKGRIPKIMYKQSLQMGTTQPWSR